MKDLEARIRKVEQAIRGVEDFAARRNKTWGDRFFTQEEVEEMRAFETGEP